MIQRAGKLLLKAFITIFLTLLVIEIGVRAIPLYPDSFEIPDPNYGWRMPASYSGNYLNILCLGEYTNRISINGHGLNDVEHAYGPAAGVERILFIGDSMVAGFEVPLEQTFYRRLETLLNNGSNEQQYEVIGAGHRGYGTDLELLFYEHEAYQYKPDLVVLVIQPGNDIQDNHPDLRLQGASSFPYFSLENEQLVLHTPDITTVPTNPAAPSINPLHDTLYQISYLYRLLYRRISVMQSVRQTFTAAPDPNDGAKTAKLFEQAWAVLRALVTRFRDEVESGGGQFAVMVTTSRSLIGEAGEHTYQMVYAMLDDLQIDYLKLEPAFTADMLPTLQYKCDQHWTPAGHEVVAAQLAAFLPPLSQTNTGENE